MQESKLPYLPFEILSLIVDDLPLHTSILLSQTCQRMRSLLQPRSFEAFQALSTEKRLEVIGKLLDVLPNYRLCAVCSALHYIDGKDVPGNRSGCPRHGPWLARTSDSSVWDHLIFGLHRRDSKLHIVPYRLAYHHVQLALEYKRSGNVHQEYLARLMESYTVTFPAYLSMELTFSAFPKIANGNFLLLTRWEFKERKAPLSPQTLGYPEIRFCPHLGFVTAHTALRDSPPLSFDLLASIFYKGAPRALDETRDLPFSCRRCPTDLFITLRPGRVTVEVWKNLGSGQSPDDRYWPSHLEGPEKSRDRKREVYHSRGSVRALYDGAVEHL